MDRWLIHASFILAVLPMACHRQSATSETSDAASAQATSAPEISAPAASSIPDAASAVPNRALPQWYLAATSSQPLSLVTLGPQLVVRTKGGPFVANADGTFAPSPMQARLRDQPEAPIMGNSPADAWAVEPYEPAPGEGQFKSYTILRWEGDKWAFPGAGLEFSDMPGTWYEGFTALGPGKAVAMNHGGTSDVAEVLTVFDSSSAQPREVGSKLGHGVRFIVGTSTGDVYAASETAFVHVPPNDREKSVELPEEWAPSNVTAMSRLASDGVVVAFFRKKVSIVARLQGAKWDIVQCPFDNAVTRLAPTTDGAIWVSTNKSVWRYHQRWESVPFRDALGDAGIKGSYVNDLAATAADDAWISVGAGPAKGPSALLHTKSASGVQRLPLKADGKP